MNLEREELERERFEGGSGVEEVWNEPCGNGTDTRVCSHFSTFFDVNRPPRKRFPMTYNVAYESPNVFKLCLFSVSS